MLSVTNKYTVVNMSVENLVVCTLVEWLIFLHFYIACEYYAD